MKSRSNGARPRPTNMSPMLRFIALTRRRWSLLGIMPSPSEKRVRCRSSDECSAVKSRMASRRKSIWARCNARLLPEMIAIAQGTRPCLALVRSAPARACCGIDDIDDWLERVPLLSRQKRGKCRTAFASLHKRQTRFACCSDCERPAARDSSVSLPSPRTASPHPPFAERRQLVFVAGLDQRPSRAQSSCGPPSPAAQVSARHSAALCQRQGCIMRVQPRRLWMANDRA